MGSLFDDVGEDELQSNRENKPIWTLDWKSYDKSNDLLKWLKSEVEYLEGENRSRFETVRRNLSLFKGIQYWSQGGNVGNKTNIQDTDNALAKATRAYQKFVVNHIFDLTMQRIARLVEYKPGITFVPENSDEWADKLAAKATEAYAESIWYSNEFEEFIVPTIALWKSVMGEAYTFTLWKDDAGAQDPDWVKASKAGKKVPLVDDKGKQVEEDGEKKFIEGPVFMGDVATDVEDTFNVLLERNGKYMFKDVDYCFRREIMTVDAAKYLYPDAKNKITATKSVKWYDFEQMEMKTLANMVVVWKMYHRNTRFMREGAEIHFTRDTVLQKPEVNKYKHGKLPATQICDIKLPRELHGVSFFNNIKGATGAYNNLTNMLMRNATMVSHPKWMLPAGSAKLEQLANDITIVQFKGMVAPNLVTAQCMPPDMFKLRSELKEDAQQVAQVYGVSRGAPPPGVEAAVALQFLEEQEDKAASPDLTEFNRWISSTSKLQVSVGGQFYAKDEKRIKKILGPNGAFMARRINPETLSKGYECYVRNSTALPKSRTARMQSLVFLNKNYPGMFSQEQVLEMMDLTQNDKFITAGTVAVRAAEEENDRLLHQEEVYEPEEFEDHIQHWRVHARIVQEHAFRYDYPEAIRADFKKHIIATEMLMWEKATKNALYMQALAPLVNFPLYYEPAPIGAQATPPGMPPMPGAPTSGLNAGADSLAPATGLEQEQPNNPALGDAEAEPDMAMGGVPQPPVVPRA